jgi:hypothetical protein
MYDVVTNREIKPVCLKEMNMDEKQMKVVGIIALGICVVCLFVAVERYQSNANNVRAMNQMQQSSPFGGMMGQMTGQTQMKPATPAATKYALIFALISGVGGGVLLGKGIGR